MLFLPIEYKLHEGREFFSWVYFYIPRTVSAIIELCIHVWMNSVYHSLQVYLLTCCLPSPINLGVSGKQEIHPFIHHSSQILAWCLATKSFICESMNTNNNFACVLQLSLYYFIWFSESYWQDSHLSTQNTECRDYIESVNLVNGNQNWTPDLPTQFSAFPTISKDLLKNLLCR